MANNRKRKQQQQIHQCQMLVQDILEEDDLLLEFFNDLDEEEDNPAPAKAQNPNKERDHVQHHKNLMKDYFLEDCTYNKKDFSRRFQLDKPIFLWILEDLTAQYPYFLCKPNCTVKIGLSPEQKITAVLQQLAYVVPCDSTDK
jgi:hypothetical protein